MTLPIAGSGAVQMNWLAVSLVASFFVAISYQPAFAEAVELQRVPICNQSLKHCGWSAKIIGTIDDATVNKLNTLVAETRRKVESQQFTLEPPYVELDTAGGSVAAAMAIGRPLRKERASVAIDNGAICNSACVLIFAGAVNRAIEPTAKLGIHRPYLEVPRGNITPARDQEAYQRTLQDIRSYFREMNVSEQLADAMVRIEPKDVRFLNYDLLRTFGLTATDPVEQETLDLQEAQAFGLDRQEYMKRKSLSERICPKGITGFPQTECWFSVMETGRAPAASKPTGKPDFSSFGIPLEPQR